VVTEGDRSLACAGVIACALGGCTLITDSFLTNEFSGDPFPIHVETSSGAVVLGIRTAGTGDHVAVLDLLSPLTVTDPGPDLPPSVSYVDITLLGKPGPTDPLGGTFELSTALPRARFTEAQVISMHPCKGPSATCTVGPTGTRPFTGIIGADVLAGDAVRLRLGDNQIFVLPDVGGKDRGRTLSCEAVFDSPYRGGGTLVFPSTELAFGNRRITLQACLGPAPDAPVQGQRGADALLVMSTGIGTSIIDETAYERYRGAHLADLVPELASLPIDAVFLPSGRVSGRRANLRALTLVAASTSNALAPCRQVYAHHLLAKANCSDSDDCPCENGKDFCAVPAMLELTPPSGVDVLVVPDTEPTLQALRTELRPDQPEVDGLIGTDVLRAAELDVDYPHDRLLARCPGDSCRVRAQLAQEDDRCQVNRCIKGLANPPGCPLPAASSRSAAPIPRD
jgi:hypothetical protein